VSSTAVDRATISELPPGANGTTRGQIHLEIGNRHLAGDERRDPPAQRTNTRQQLTEGERLGQIIIRADFEAGDTVVHRVTRSEHEYWSLDASIADDAAEIESRSARKHHVEEHDVVAAHDSQRAPSGERQRMDDINPVFAESGGQNCRELRIVFDQQ